MLISRNEAIERLDNYRDVARTDPDGARCLAVSVLLDIIDDEGVRYAFRRIGTDTIPEPNFVEDKLNDR